MPLSLRARGQTKFIFYRSRSWLCLSRKRYIIKPLKSCATLLTDATSLFGHAHLLTFNAPGFLVKSVRPGDRRSQNRVFIERTTKILKSQVAGLSAREA